MKIRDGFVSNSSSTSFIVPKDLKDEAIQRGLSLIAIYDIKKWLKKADDMGIDFIIRDLPVHWKIMEMDDGDYITEPYVSLEKNAELFFLHLRRTCED